MSKKSLFSIKIESVSYLNKSSKLSITNEFEEADIIKIVNKNLAQEGFKPDLDSITYTDRDNNLFIEGSAYHPQHNHHDVAESTCNVISNPPV